MDSEFNCTMCPRPDHADNMVQCDRCDQWQHYGCAVVNDSVANRSWVCGNCTTPQQKEDVVSNISGSSCYSTTSSFSDSLSRLMEKQHAERARAELALQRRHLDEQQRLIDSVLGEEPEGAVGFSSVKVSSKVLPADASTPLSPGSQQTSPAQQAATVASISTPLMVSIPVTTLTPPASTSVQNPNDQQAALRVLKNHIEQCEKRSKPSADELAALHAQLELCRTLFEGFQSTASEGGQRSNDNKPVLNQLPKLTADKQRTVLQTGAIPKASRTLAHVTKDDTKNSERRPGSTNVEAANPQNPLWPLRDPVSRMDLSLVSQPVATATGMPPNNLEPTGKRHALSNLNEQPTYHYPTTNSKETIREQLRFDARPEEICMSPLNSREQMRHYLARPGDTNVSTQKNGQPKQPPSNEQTRENFPHTVDSCCPRQSEIVPPDFLPQVTPPPRPIGAPTQSEVQQQAVQQPAVQQHAVQQSTMQQQMVQQPAVQQPAVQQQAMQQSVVQQPAVQESAVQQAIHCRSTHNCPAVHKVCVEHGTNIDMMAV